MTQRYSVIQWIAAGVILSCVGLVSQGVASAQTPPAETRQAEDEGGGASGFREISYQTSDGGVIFGNLYGAGSHAVLLGHGAVFDKESWDLLAKRLAAEGHQALAIDFRGYGKSKAGRSRGGLHEDITGGIRYLREQGAARVSVIGASMGGRCSRRCGHPARPWSNRWPRPAGLDRRGSLAARGRHDEGGHAAQRRGNSAPDALRPLDDG
jgi:hypothetical protein